MTSLEEFIYEGTLEFYGKTPLKSDTQKNVRNGDDIRLGQFWFNKLSYMRPDISEKIRSTNADPFYVDAKLDAFWKVVSDSWEEE